VSAIHLTDSISNPPNQTVHIIMVAFAFLRTSFFLISLLAPAALAAPAADKTTLTPFGERPVGDVYTVPEGVLSDTRTKRPELTLIF
jgi:hypothetical protein